jgi:DNA-binding NarL/FixJ family response regulator
MTTPTAQCIMLVDDHPAVRQGLALLLTHSGFTICAEADCLAPTLTCLESVRPDLVIVDLTLRESDGLAVLVALSARGIPSLVYSMHEDARHVQQALAAGTDGYVTKRETAGILVHAIQQVLLGQRFVSERAAAALAGWLSTHAPQEAAPLSRREGQIFLLLGKGHSMDAIGSALLISARTVESYAQRIMTKFGLSTMRELRQRAIHDIHAPAPD